MYLKYGIFHLSTQAKRMTTEIGVVYTTGAVLDLQLTKRGDYAVRAALSLARASGDGGYRKIREIAAEMSIPERYTHEILTLLVRGSLVEAMAGKQGGYRLRHAPTDVSRTQPRASRS